MDLAADASGRILLVGSGETAQATEALLDAENWVCSRSEAPAGVLHRLRIEPVIDLVLLVPESQPQPYVELCRQIKFDARTALVSVVFIVAPGQTECRADLFRARADDCIQLPAPRDEILVRLSNAYRAKCATDSLEDATAVISSLANAIEGRDTYTRGHVERVGTYSVEMGQRLGVTPEDLSVLRIGGIIHDIGKVAVPDHILNKPGKLTDEEMDIVKRHPIVGHDILQPLRTFRTALPIVRWHHERPNGTGYPDGLQAEQLPLLARIVAVADVFDALSTARSYRPAFPPEKYRAILAEEAANGDLDQLSVTTLLQTLDESTSAFAAMSPEPVQEPAEAP